MNPLIFHARRRWMFLGGAVVLLLAAVAFVPLKWVRVKMLPFDNKSAFQVMIDMPDGTPLEQTTRVAQALGQCLGTQPDVINYQIYAGIAACGRKTLYRFHSAGYGHTRVDGKPEGKGMGGTRTGREADQLQRFCCYAWTSCARNVSESRLCRASQASPSASTSALWEPEWRVPCK
ncbi:MAG: hypothetical protein WB814_09020, partial [Candidatus Sulfotelmatobacter sp.]